MKIPSGAYFPQSYLTDMFKFLSRNKDKIEIITYQGLEWNDDYDYDHGYPVEKKAWLSSIKHGESDNSKAYLLIQYDVDTRPERTMNLLRHEVHHAIPANIMCFVKRVDRKHLKKTGELRYTDYELDVDLLRTRQDTGSVIGYHSNCYERSHFNKEKAPYILQDDINILSKDFEIDFYTAHGGVPCPDGLNNRDIKPLRETIGKTRWVHNGATPYFNKQFSDGGHNSPLRDPVNRDLRDFVTQMKPGGRYRILVHPQYYDTSFRPSKRYSGTDWYDAMLSKLEENENYDTWEGVRLSGFDSKNSIHPIPIDSSLSNSCYLNEGIKSIGSYLRNMFFRK